MQKTIGVVGIGDLGSQLALQIASAGLNVCVWDINPEAGLSLASGAIDSTRSLTLSDAEKIQRATSLDELISTCSIIHWAVPSKYVADLPQVTDKTVLLHDSVMQNSVDAIVGRPDKSNFVFVHCLMNDSLRVLVATDNGDHSFASKHLSDIGLNPQLITQDEHDILMARTQGVFALLIELGMAKELQGAYDKGNLAPSAEELYHAVMNRESRWTRATIESILANPKLKSFAIELAQTLEKNQKTE